MRLKNRDNQTKSVALIMHANVRTPHYYRNTAQQSLPKDKRSAGKLKQKAADLIAKDLPKADAVMDERLQRHANSIASASGLSAPEIDIDWPSFLHDKEYQESVRKKVNPKNDPLIDEVIDEAKRMRKEVVTLAKRLDEHFKLEHSNARK